MIKKGNLWLHVGVAWLLAWSSVLAGDSAKPVRVGETFDLKEGTAKVTKVEMLPFVDDDYSRRFKFDSYENPKLKELRERYKLDEVIASGKDEFLRQLLLMDWTHRQFKRFGTPSAKPQGALEIFADVERGHTFFCAHYAEAFVSCAASVGWVARELALRRHQGVAKGGSSEHSVVEIWSNQYRKWVMLDPTSKMYLERDAQPLNAFEIRQEWFYQGGSNLVFVVGKQRYRKSDLPIFIGKFAGFGDLTVDPDELDKYGFIGYIPNTDLMDRGEDYGGMFITRDALCEGTSWHTRKNPENPAVEPYFPIGQATMCFSGGGKLRVSLKTFTPNFQKYEAQIDAGEWKTIEPEFNWEVHPGRNQLRVRTVNKFGVYGSVSSAEVEAVPGR